MDNRERLSNLASLLEAEDGWTTELNEDDDLILKTEDRILVVTYNDEEGTQLRIILPNFWSIDSPEELLTVFKVANDINATLGGMKIYVQGGWVMAEANLMGHNLEDLVVPYAKSVHSLPELFVVNFGDVTAKMLLSRMLG